MNTRASIESGVGRFCHERVGLCGLRAGGWTFRLDSARLELPDSFQAGVAESGFERLSVTFPHADRAGALPPHHRDPFDRMLVAQAIEEHLTLVTHDAALAAYEVAILPA